MGGRFSDVGQDGKGICAPHSGRWPPFVLLFDGLEVGGHTAESVSELVNKLGVVAGLAIELDRNLTFGVIRRQRNRGGILFFAIRQTLPFNTGLNEFRAVAFITEALAGGFDAEALADGAVAESACDAVVEEIEMAILEFHHFSTIDTDEVVVIGVVDEIGIVGCLPVTKFDFMNKIGVHQE
tara:strand:+ start:7862 stop:8407 length:546 start_codon:yes stop_codon:yes gene_type:complete